MPTYEYRCSNCGHQLEAVQSFSDAALSECPACGEPQLRKLFGNVGVVFKGSGFYRNDSRNEAKSKKPAGAAPKKPDSADSGSSKPAAGGSSTGSSSGSSSTSSASESGAAGTAGSSSTAPRGSGGSSGGSAGSGSSS